MFLDAIRRRDGEAAAIAAFEQTGGAAELNGFTIVAIAVWMREVGRLDDALALLAAATPEQVEENPAMLLLRARMRLEACLPASYVADVLEHQATMPRPNYVRDDAGSDAHLTDGLSDLRELRRYLASLRSPGFSAIAELNELYFEALIEVRAKRPPTRLIDLLSDPKTVVSAAPLAEVFGLEFDTSALWSQLEQAKRFGGWDDEQLRAAFAAVMLVGKPLEVAKFVQENRAGLQEFLLGPPVAAIEVEALAKSGQTVEARRLLDDTPEFDDQLRGKLSDLVSEAEGADPSALRLARFDQTNADEDLRALVEALYEAHDYARLATYAPKLWRRRHRTDDARIACRAMISVDMMSELAEFLHELGSLVDDDPGLQLCAAVSAHQRGDLALARKLLDQVVSANGWDTHTRQLEVMLRIETGDWKGLAPLVKRDLLAQEERSAYELIQASRIAYAIDHGSEMELAFAAAAKAPDDPTVLVGAFEMAFRCNAEHHPEVAKWIHTAQQLSTEQGPVFVKEFKDIVAEIVDRRERSQSLNDMMMAGELPLFIAARPLGVSLAAIVFDRMALNLDTRDSRRRMVLPAYAGNRLPWDIQRFERPTFDVLSLYILEFAGVLDIALDAFEEVIIPAETLRALFEDLIDAKDVQPSRVMRAERLKRLVDDRKLFVLDETGLLADRFVDADEDVNILYGAAERDGGVLIHTSPMFAVGSDMERTIEPISPGDRLASPVAVIDALAGAGELSVEAERVAREHRGIATSTWTVEAPVDLSSPIFVDGVALHYLDEAGVLKLLIETGAQLYVRQSVVDHADQEIRADERRRPVVDGIERVRDKLSRRLLSGHAKAGPVRHVMSKRAKGFRERDEASPLMNVLADPAGADLIVCDDRAINRSGVVEMANGQQVPTATSLDMINMLRTREIITASQWSALRQKLRSAGLGLIPCDSDEIVAAAKRADWSRGPGRDLEAIRDSIHLPILRGMLVLPSEQFWLRWCAIALASAARRCWGEIDTLDLASQAATYLFRLIPDPTTLTDTQAFPELDAFTSEYWGAVLASLGISFDMSRERFEAYDQWFENIVLARLGGRTTAAIEVATDMLADHIVSPKLPEVTRE